MGGKAYPLTVTDNHSGVVLSDAVARRQDLPASFVVLYRALEDHKGCQGAPANSR